MKLIIFIKGFNLKNHTAWGGPNMVFMTPAHALDCPKSLSQSRHHTYTKFGVNASDGMGLAQGMSAHVVLQQMSYLTDVCDVTSLSKKVLTKKRPKQSGRGFLGVALRASSLTLSLSLRHDPQRCMFQ